MEECLVLVIAPDSIAAAAVAAAHFAIADLDYLWPLPLLKPSFAAFWCPALGLDIQLRLALHAVSHGVYFAIRRVACAERCPEL